MDASFRSFQAEVVPECLSRGVGIVGMKALGGYRAAIVHEGVHAWADLSKFKSGVLDECAGYLTEVVYLKHLNRRLSGHPIYDAANGLAAALDLYSKRGKKLTRDDCKALADAIVAEPAYQGLTQ